jgi:transglutaminase-like putative cysteine protease
MPGIYKLFTAIVAIIGSVSLVSTGEINPGFSIIGSILLYGYYRSLRGYRQLPREAVGALSFTTFIVFLVNFYINKDVFISVAQMTLIFQAIKSFDIKEPWDPLQVFFMSLLQLLMASELTNSIYFGIIFVLFVIFIVISILVGHFVIEGQRDFGPFLRPMAFITIVTLVLTAMFFVTIPRLRSGFWGGSLSRGIKTTGFSEKVDFGSFGRVKQDETIVMRMVVRPDKGGPYYLRGMTFDYFDGMAWYDTHKDSVRVYKTPDEFHTDVPLNAERYEAEVYLEPLDSEVIFTFKRPYRMESEGFFLREDNAGALYMRQKVSKRFFYKLFSVDGFYADKEYLASYLQIPPDIEGIKRLAEEVTAGAKTLTAKAEAIRGFLLKNYEYSLFTREPPEGVTPLEDFLFYTKRGYCEHFATAMVLMLRSIGIPARLVTGFLTGEKNEMGDYYLIRQSDAHSWVEAFIDGRWLIFDPTPPVFVPHKRGLLLFVDVIKMKWSRYVVGFSSYDQVRMATYVFNYPVIRLGMFRSLLSWIILIIITLIIISILIGGLRMRPFPYVRYRGVSAEYMRFVKRVRRNGGRLSPASDTEEVLTEAIRTGRFDRDAVRRFIEAYRFLRFSGRQDEAMLREFYEQARRLRRDHG